MLRTLVPMLNNVGMETGWRVLAGSSDFFGVTKRLHNGLQGETLRIGQAEKAAWLAENEGFSVYNHIHHDCVVVHDPQPLPLARSYPRKQPWVWRCHLDLSEPHPEVWNLVAEYATAYDAMIVRHPLDALVRPVIGGPLRLGSYSSERSAQKSNVAPKIK